MSIKPRFAEAILSGQKRFELRRTRPTFGRGSTIAVYSSSPSQRVIGTFGVGEVLELPLNELWARVGGHSGVTRDEFDAYFDGKDLGIAIEVCEPRALTPQPLGFRPPQSYQFLRPENVAAHRELASTIARQLQPLRASALA